jgi:hypothetical protein
MPSNFNSEPNSNEGLTTFYLDGRLRKLFISSANTSHTSNRSSPSIVKVRLPSPGSRVQLVTNNPIRSSVVQFEKGSAINRLRSKAANLHSRQLQNGSSSSADPSEGLENDDELSRKDNQATATHLLDAAIDSSSFRFLDNHLRFLLGSHFNFRVPPLRVYTGSHADAAAQALQADAMTYRSHLFFRLGKFDPNSASGLGLIAHEISHLHQQRSSRRADDQSVTESGVEERNAIATESRVRNEVFNPRQMASNTRLFASPLSNADRTPNPPQQGTALSPAGPFGPIKTALQGRTLSNPDSPSNTDQAITGLSSAAIRGLKNEIYHEILDRIRSDFERGG